MLPVTLLTSLLAALLVAGWIGDWIKRRNRTKNVRAVGFPIPWLRLLERGLPQYRALPLDLRERLQEKAFAKLNDLAFAGANESREVTDQMRVSVCAHLCLLHARLRIPPIPAIRQVVVGSEADIAAGLEAPSCPWGASTLVTAWDPALNLARSAREERDSEIMEHWRRLRPPDDRGPAAEHLYFAGWARSLYQDAVDRMPAAAERAPELGQSDALFAAATEAFIRHPAFLLASRPSLYDGLRHFYQLDPARWGLDRLQAPAPAGPPAR
jgi:hypothetical protein